MRKSLLGIITAILLMACSTPVFACEVSITQPMSLTDNIEVTLDKADVYVSYFTISEPIDWGEFDIMINKAITEAAKETDLKFYNVAKLQNNNFERQYSF